MWGFLQSVARVLAFHDTNDVCHLAEVAAVGDVFERHRRNKAYSFPSRATGRRFFFSPSVRGKQEKKQQWGGGGGKQHLSFPVDTALSMRKRSHHLRRKLAVSKGIQLQAPK